MSYGESKRMFGSDPGSPLYLYRGRIVLKSRELMKVRQSGHIHTGTLLSEEMEINPFMRAYLEAHEKEDSNKQFLIWVASGFRKSFPKSY